MPGPFVHAAPILPHFLMVPGFFPYPENGPWDNVFAQTFSPNLIATFNNTHHYNYHGWLEVYRTFNATLGLSFDPFRHGFTSIVAVPNANGDKGGTVFMAGWEGGLHRLLKRELWFSDAAFAVVNDVGGGKRRIVEFRESSNMPSTVRMPRENEWECGFKHR